MLEPEVPPRYYTNPRTKSLGTQTPWNIKESNLSKENQPPKKFACPSNRNRTGDLQVIKSTLRSGRKLQPDAMNQLDYRGLILKSVILKYINFLNEL